MKQKPVAQRAVVAKTKPNDLAPLIAEVRRLIQSARRGVASVVNTLQVMTNFEIGRRIVEHEQKGEKRAAYGAELVKELSARLMEEFGNGFSERNLAYMRKFYLLWQPRLAEISQTPSANVNYYDREVKLPEENPTIGIVLCQQKKQTVVELTLPKDANIHAREYQLYLPSKELLQAKLLEWVRAAGKCGQ